MPYIYILMHLLLILCTDIYICYKLDTYIWIMFSFQCTHLANKTSNDHVILRNVQNIAIVLKLEIYKLKNEKKKQISNHWPGSVVANVHINEIELNEKVILAGDGWTDLRVYW